MQLRGRTGPLGEDLNTNNWYATSSISPYIVSAETYPLTRYWKDTYGDNTPGYHQRLKKGELLPFPRFYQIEQEVRCLSGPLEFGVNYDNGTWSKQWRDNGWTVGLLEVPTQDEMIEKLDAYQTDQYVQEAAARIYSGGGWDSLTFMAEFTKTVLMFKNFLTNLHKLLEPSDLLRRSQKFSDAWLEGRYGWRVLYYDMKSIEEAIANLDRKRQRFSERAGNTEEDTTMESFDVSWSGGVYTRHVSVTTTERVSVNGHVVADIDPPSFVFNPVVTSWELVTASFVVDWIINIGQMIEAWSFLAIAQKHEASSGIRIDVDTTINVTSSVDTSLVTNGTPWISHYGSSLIKTTCKRRLPGSVSLLPYFSLNLNTFKVVDLIALVVQRIRRK